MRAKARPAGTEAPAAAAAATEMRTRILASISILAMTIVLATMARADEASGTWTGEVELRGNYYWETSTRVVAPEARIRLESPVGVRVDAGYLLDAITSASIA